MHPILTPYIKICCIKSSEEARIAIRYGASALGFVSAMPSGPGVIEDDLITDIRGWIGERARTVLLTSRADAKGISQQLRAHRPLPP